MARIIDGATNNIVGKYIREERKKQKISQKGLSVKLELMGIYVCPWSFSRLENNKRTVTDIEIDAISKILNVSLDYLFGREDENRGAK